MKASIIVPTYNRKERLKECVLALLNQNFKDYEIIVVDDGSSDGTKDMINGLQKEHNNLRYLRQKNKGPGIARNYGVSEAEGNIIALTDDDCIADSNWLKEIVNSFKDKKVGVVGGGYVFHENPGLIGLWQSCNVKRGIKEGRLRHPSFFESNNLAMHKEVFLEVGGFNPLFGPKDGSEDFNLNYQTFKKGYKLVFNETAKVKHLHKLNLKGVLKQNYIAGRGDIVFMFINKEKRIFKPYHFLLFPLIAFKKTIGQIKYTNKKYNFPVFYVLNFLGLLYHQIGRCVRCIDIKKPSLFFYVADKSVKESI